MLLAATLRSALPQRRLGRNKMAEDRVPRIAARLAELSMLLRGGNLTDEQQQAAWQEFDQLTAELERQDRQQHDRRRAAAAAGGDSDGSSSSGESLASDEVVENLAAAMPEAGAGQQAQGQGAAGAAPQAEAGDASPPAQMPAFGAAQQQQ